MLLSGVPPDQLLNALKQQLKALSKGQTSTTAELQRAQAVNEELFKQATEAADRRERIAVKQFQSTNKQLQEEIGNMRTALEEARKTEARLKDEIETLQRELDRAKSMGESHAKQIPIYESQIDELKSLHKAMAARIDSLESQLEGMKESNEKLGVVLKSEGDRWAREEADLKRNIRDLEERLRKRKAELRGMERSFVCLL